MNAEFVTGAALILVTAYVLAASLYFRQRGARDRTWREDLTRQNKELSDQIRRLLTEPSDRIKQLQEVETLAEHAGKYRDILFRAERRVEEDLLSIRLKSGLDRLDHIHRLGELRSEASAAIEPLTDLFTQDDCKASTKWYILNALRRISREATEDLIANVALRDRHPSIQAYAAFLAGEMNAQSAQDQLRLVLEDDQRISSARRNSAWALEAMGKKFLPTS